MKTELGQFFRIFFSIVSTIYEDLSSSLDINGSKAPLNSKQFKIEKTLK